MSTPGFPEDDQTTAFERWEVLEVAVTNAVPALPDIGAEIEDARSKARDAGHAEGLEIGRKRAEQECARMQELAESFAHALDNLDFRLADTVLELALDVARQVIAGELAVRPERILDVVNLALQQMAETSREARLLLNPDDAALVRPHLEKALDKSRLRLVEDARIVRGGCLIETPQGDLDATLQTRWRQVVQVLGSNTGWIE